MEGRFHWDHFECFRQLVLAIAFAWGRRNVSNLALLTQLRIEGAQGKRKRPRGATMSTSEAQNELRRLVWRGLVAHLEELPTGDAVREELDRLLIA